MSMGKLGTYPMVFMIAALVFYGGSGINVASFCCTECQSAGIKGIAKGFCREIHDHGHESDSHHSASDFFEDSDEMSCFLTHIMYDWSTSNTSIINPEPAVCFLMSIAAPGGLVAFSPFIEDRTYENACGPPILCPHTYLSLLTTLLI